MIHVIHCNTEFAIFLYEIADFRMVSKIAEDMTPPVSLQKVLIFLSKIIPRAKLVPQKDLADLAFRELKKK